MARTLPHREVSLLGRRLRRQTRERRQHLLDLIEASGFRMVEDTSTRSSEPYSMLKETVTVTPIGGCNFGDRLLYLPFKAAERHLGAYLICLHELGHAADRERQHDISMHDQRLEYEAAAWLWAIEHSREPLRQEDYDLIWEQLCSYSTFWPMVTAGSGYRTLVELLGKKTEALMLSIEAEEMIVEHMITIKFEGYCQPGYEPRWYRQLRREGAAERAAELVAA